MVRVTSKIRDTHISPSRLYRGVLFKAMKHTSSSRYELLINHIGQYVHDHVGEPLTLDSIAGQVGISRFHLNRIFHAATGFQLGEFIQRRRLEQAYLMLSEAQLTVIEVALAVGYESHSAFSRAFLKAFGRQPVDVRKGEAPRFALPQLIKQAPRPEVTAEILTLEERTLVGLYGQGFADQSYVELAERLYAALARELKLPGGFDYSAQQMIGVSLDRPWLGEQDESRFFAGVLLTVVPPNPKLARYCWPAGNWARFTHIGPYRTMWQTISRIYAGWVIPNGISLRDAAIVQRYINDSRSTPEERLETHLYFPLASSE